MKVMSVEETQVSSGCWGPWGGDQGWVTELSQESFLFISSIGIEHLRVPRAHLTLLNLEPWFWKRKITPQSISQ